MTRTGLIVVAVVLAMAGCSKDKGAAGGPGTQKQAATDQQGGHDVSNPKTYCEKAFSCKLAVVKGEQARQTLLSRRDVVIKHCEELMSKMPAPLRRQYEACVNVPCGEQLAKCVEGAASRAAKELGLPVKKEGKARGAKETESVQKKAPSTKATGSSTPTREATPQPTGELPPPQLDKPEITPDKLKELKAKGALNPPPPMMADVAKPPKELEPNVVQPPPGVKVTEPTLQVVGGGR